MENLTRFLRLATLALVAAAALAFPATAGAQAAEAAPEARVKAAFLYKFLAYVEWTSTSSPDPAADSPFVIGVTGADDVAAELEQLVPGRTMNGRPLQVRRLAENDPLRGVNMVFVGKGASARLANVARAAQPQGILVVSEAERGLEAGAVINLVVVEDRVGFEVSLESARRSGLTINSRMLPVARRVVPRSTG